MAGLDGGDVDDNGSCVDGTRCWRSDRIGRSLALVAVQLPARLIESFDKKASLHSDMVSLSDDNDEAGDEAVNEGLRPSKTDAIASLSW